MGAAEAGLQHVGFNQLGLKGVDEGVGDRLTADSEWTETVELESVNGLSE